MTDWNGPKAPDEIHLERTSGAARRKAKKVRKARADAAEAAKTRSPRPSGPSGARSSGPRTTRPRGPQPGEGRAADGSDERPPDARRAAVEALVRIEEGGAYANLALGPVLERSGLDTRDRGLVTELVYGTTRMRRACDWLVDRYVTGTRPLDARTRSALRLGAYQLVVLGQPPHAAVTTAVSAAPKRSRGLVNAVLRKVAAEHEENGTVFPDPATALSYPDWILERLTADLGSERAVAALEA
ncbi:MAG TPA: transcription antitermination factor NusB, partial [Iamia sp.]|nr:transcription antitermination factor NusB [Iamia sp.]